MGSDTEIDTPDGRRVRGRAYPWGCIEVDNEDHCDFVKLRQMLIRSHMEELKEHTHNNLYEKYRSEKLIGMGVTQDHSVFKEVNPAAKMAEERALHEAKLQKMEVRRYCMIRMARLGRIRKSLKTDTDFPCGYLLPLF